MVQIGDFDPHQVGKISVINFGMTSIWTGFFCQPRRSIELIAWAENTSDDFIWPLYVVVKRVGGRIETEAELDS